MHDTKKGKYTDDENELIITTINQAIETNAKERDVIKQLSIQLNRGYAGIMSHIRKLKAIFPERFTQAPGLSTDDQRLNSWEPAEEEFVIHTVNEFLSKGKSLSSAITEIEHNLTRTQGAIYQRIYTLRRKYPERFNQLPAKRPRKRKKMVDWQIQRPTIRPIDELSSLVTLPKEQVKQVEKQQLSSNSSTNDPIASASTEEDMVYQAFKRRYGQPNQEMRKKLFQLMHTYGPTRVSIALFTIEDDKEFPNYIISFLEKKLLPHESM